MNTPYQDVNELETYKTIESALMTCCPVCGDRLEWTLEVGYDPVMDSYYIEVKYEDIPGR